MPEFDLPEFVLTNELNFDPEYMDFDDNDFDEDLEDLKAQYGQSKYEEVHYALS